MSSSFDAVASYAAKKKAQKMFGTEQRLEVPLLGGGRRIRPAPAPQRRRTRSYSSESSYDEYCEEGKISVSSGYDGGSSYGSYDDVSVLSVDKDLLHETPTMSLGGLLKSIAVTLVTFAGMGAAIAASVSAASSGIPTWIMTGFSGVLSPVVAFEETVIATLPSRRNIINKLRMVANRLKEENRRLTHEIDDLEGVVDQVSEVEEALTNIATAQGRSVNELVNLVKTNDTIIRKMRKNVKAKTLQDVISLVIKSDRDGNFVIDDGELYVLTMKLDAMCKAQEVELDKELFQETVKADRSVSGVLNAVKELLEDDEKVDYRNQGQESMFKITCGSSKNFGEGEGGRGRLLGTGGTALGGDISNDSESEFSDESYSTSDS